MFLPHLNIVCLRILTPTGEFKAAVISLRALLLDFTGCGGAFGAGVTLQGEA